MFSSGAVMQTGFAKVMTSDNGGLNNDQISEMAVNKIVSVSETAPEPIRQQAEAFAENVRIVVQYHIELARKEERAKNSCKLHIIFQQVETLLS